MFLSCHLGLRVGLRLRLELGLEREGKGIGIRGLEERGPWMEG